MSEDIKIDPAVMTLGKTEYVLCSACHGPAGQGAANIGPPLANSEWVNGPVENLIGIQFRGLKGEIKVDGVDYNFPAGMMAVGMTKSDDQIAAVLTYIRNSFGNEASAVTSEMVAKYRAANQEEIAKGPMNQIEVKDLIDPFVKKDVADIKELSPAPPPTLPDVPESGLGASGMGIFAFVLVCALTGIGVLRMKGNNK